MEDSVTPFFSIAMPVRNASKFLRIALQSIEVQQGMILEVLIADGGSTDHTLDIVREFRGKMNIKIVSTEDKGVADALNKCLEIAVGKIFCWLNADDFYTNKSALADVMSHFLENDIDYLVCMNQTCDANGIPQKTLIPWIPRKKSYSGGCNIFTGALFFTADSFKKIGGFDSRYRCAFEYPLIAGLVKTFRGSVHSSSTIATLRVHNDTITNKQRGLMDDELKEIFPVQPKYSIWSRLYFHWEQDSLMNLMRTKLSVPKNSK